MPPIRFPTEAANDPGMTPRGDPDLPEVGADGTPRGHRDGTPEAGERRERDVRDREGKPGSSPERSR
jgi:hypothetical protein